MVEDTEPGEEETPGNVWLTQSEDGTGTAYNFEPEPCGSLLSSWFQKKTVHDPYMQRYSYHYTHYAVALISDPKLR